MHNNVAYCVRLSRSVYCVQTAKHSAELENSLDRVLNAAARVVSSSLYWQVPPKFLATVTHRTALTGCTGECRLQPRRHDVPVSSWSRCQVGLPDRLLSLSWWRRSSTASMFRQSSPHVAVSACMTVERFYRVMLRRARYCYGKVVCPSVPPSVRPWRSGIVIT